jgi:hypothetical protein
MTDLCVYAYLRICVPVEQHVVAQAWLDVEVSVPHHLGDLVAIAARSVDWCTVLRVQVCVMCVMCVMCVICFIS